MRHTNWSWACMPADDPSNRFSGLWRFLHRYPAWRVCEGDGSSKAIRYFHQTYDEIEDAAKAATKRYKRRTFSFAFRKIIATALTIGTGGSGGFQWSDFYLCLIQVSCWFDIAADRSDALH